MGAVATILRLSKGKLTKIDKNPGESVEMQGEGLAGQTIDTEIYQAPGILAIPGDGAIGVRLPINGSERYGIVVALQNYNVEIDLEAGETAIYSTDSSGQTIGAIARFTADGEIHLNGDSKSFVTFAELDTALSALCATLTGHVHPSNGAVSPTLAGLDCDISAAETETIKTGG